MITYVKGKLTQAAPGFAVIEAGGIGYKLFIPASAYPRLPKIGTETLLHASLVVREISQTLYGFITEEERDFFEKVTGVSGIGPKIALSLIGHLTMDEMRQAIHNNDVAEISKVPGIGKKTAQRLIIEMRDRCAGAASGKLPGEFGINLEKDPQAGKTADAVNALINLGYNQGVAQKAVNKTLSSLPEADLPELITNALKHV